MRNVKLIQSTVLKWQPHKETCIDVLREFKKCLKGLWRIYLRSNKVNNTSCNEIGLQTAEIMIKKQLKPSSFDNFFRFRKMSALTS